MRGIDIEEAIARDRGYTLELGIPPVGIGPGGLQLNRWYWRDEDCHELGQPDIGFQTKRAALNWLAARGLLDTEIDEDAAWFQLHHPHA